MLELDDIQYFLIARPPALAARYEFLAFRNRAGGRAWLAGLTEKVATAQALESSHLDSRWVSVAFTWCGLRALGVGEAQLATFPEEFRQGMAARADVLGLTGANHPQAWLGGLADPDLHAIVVLFARDVADREHSRREHETYRRSCPGVELLSSLDMEALPPFDYAHEHFGYRDRITQIAIEGVGGEPAPGSGPPVKAGEFFLGYPDEEDPSPRLPQPDVLSRNGSYLAYLRIEEHVGAFREFLRREAGSPEREEWLAAKLMGRWRSGAPLVLAPRQDNPALAADPRRNNDFNFAEMDPHGYGCPLGAHIRRMNPRDTAGSLQRRKLIRRGGTYGPPLPEGAPEDGRERGVAIFAGCASLVRQFEFTMNVWTNDPNFHELGNERDPIFGTQDGSFDLTIPQRPVRRKIRGLPAFTTIRGGAYFFLPGLRALHYLAAPADGRKAA